MLYNTIYVFVSLFQVICAYIWIDKYALWFLLQRNALLQYGEYAAQLPKATEKVSVTLIILWYQVTNYLILFFSTGISLV